MCCGLRRWCWSVSARCRSLSECQYTHSLAQKNTTIIVISLINKQHWYSQSKISFGVWCTVRALRVRGVGDVSAVAVMQKGMFWSWRAEMTPRRAVITDSITLRLCVCTDGEEAWLAQHLLSAFLSLSAALSLKCLFNQRGTCFKIKRRALVTPNGSVSASAVPLAKPTRSKLATFHKQFPRLVTQLDVYWKITDFPPERCLCQI